MKQSRKEANYDVSYRDQQRMLDGFLSPRILRQSSDSEINGRMRVKLKPVEQLCSRIVFLTKELPEPYLCQRRGQRLRISKDHRRLSVSPSFQKLSHEIDPAKR